MRTATPIGGLNAELLKGGGDVCTDDRRRIERTGKGALQC